MAVKTTPFMVQGAGGLLAILIAVFAPSPGAASRLVPLGPLTASDAAVWATRENARLLNFDTESQSVIIIAPSNGFLMRALAGGYVPIAASTQSCGAAEDGAQGRIQRP